MPAKTYNNYRLAPDYFALEIYSDDPRTFGTTCAVCDADMLSEVASKKWMKRGGIIVSHLGESLQSIIGTKLGMNRRREPNDDFTRHNFYKTMGIDPKVQDSLKRKINALVEMSKDFNPRAAGNRNDVVDLTVLMMNHTVRTIKIRRQHVEFVPKVCFFDQKYGLTLVTKDGNRGELLAHFLAKRGCLDMFEADKARKDVLNYVVSSNSWLEENIVDDGHNVILFHDSEYADCVLRIKVLNAASASDLLINKDSIEYLSEEDGHLYVNIGMSQDVAGDVAQHKWYAREWSVDEKTAVQITAFIEGKQVNLVRFIADLHGMNITGYYKPPELRHRGRQMQTFADYDKTTKQGRAYATYIGSPTSGRKGRGTIYSKAKDVHWQKLSANKVLESPLGFKYLSYNKDHIMYSSAKRPL